MHGFSLTLLNARFGMVRRDFALSNRPVFCKTPIPHHSWMLLNDLNSTTNDRRGKRRGRQDRGGKRGREKEEEGRGEDKRREEILEYAGH
jgi:hypothetical protein